MSAEKKPPLIKWWSEAKGSGDELTYYKKSRKMVRVFQVVSVVFGVLITAAKALAFLFVYTASLLVMVIPGFDKPFFLNDNDALLQLWRVLIPVLGVLLATGVFVLVVERKAIGVSIIKNPVRSITYGLVLGCMGVGVPLLCLVLTGHINFGERNDISYLWIWFVSVILNAVLQEYLVRGYLFSLFKKAFNATAAVIIATILYIAMHGSIFEAGIITVLNVTSMSVLASLLLLYTESLLGPIIVHILWNGIGGLVFGIVSIDGDYPNLWHSVMSGNNLFSGGSTQLNGSIIVLIVTVLLNTFIFLKIKKRLYTC